MIDNRLFYCLEDHQKKDVDIAKELEELFPSISGEKLMVHKVHPKAILPTRATEKSAGLDLYSCEKVTIASGNRGIVNTGLRIMIPEGYYGRIADRSGLALVYGLRTAGGVIDSDYRGCLMIIIFNQGKCDFVIEPKLKIAQLVIEKICFPSVVECTELPSSERGANGFGSSDRNNATMEL